jgi:hypothetical protein
VTFNRQWSDIYPHAIFLVISVLIFLTVSTADYEEGVKADAYYCEMIDIWVKTNGENGWPNYDSDKGDRC